MTKKPCSTSPIAVYVRCTQRRSSLPVDTGWLALVTEVRCARCLRLLETRDARPRWLKALHALRPQCFVGGRDDPEKHDQITRLMD